MTGQTMPASESKEVTAQDIPKEVTAQEQSIEQPAGFMSQTAEQKTSTSGLDVTFKELTYEVPIKKKEPLKIISGLNGKFATGRLTALMGPSGSGKTTLMDIIAGRKNGAGKIEGELLYGGLTLPQSKVKHAVGYVEQFDTLIGEFTVEQMLLYTAELKLPRGTSHGEVKERVNGIIEKLQLSKCRKTKIGNVLKRGISGGQAKRVNIAIALITRPLILCLDEPTSGLDSSMANSVCVLLKKLAEDNCTVLAAVHSPTSFAFSLFDDLFMLQSGGRTIYSGVTSGAKNHFESLGFKLPQEVGYSVPDWLVDITSDATEEILDEGKHVAGPKEVDFAESWLKSEGAAQAAALIRQTSPPPESLPDMQGPGQLKALRTLLKYRMMTHYKDGEFLGPRIGDKIFFGVLAMSLYWGIGAENDARSIQSTASALYFFIALCGYGAAAFVPSLTLERALFYRERADGCYAAWTYYLAKFIEEAVLCTLTSLMFSAIVYNSMFLQGSFIIFALTYFLTSMIGIVLAYAVAAVAPNMEAANAMLPTYVTLCMYFGGLFILFDKIPTGWKWFSYTSFLRYSWGAMMVNQFEDQYNGEIRVFADESGKTMNVLEFYSMSGSDGIMNSIPACLGVDCGLLLLFGVLGALALTAISHVKR